MNYTLRLNWLQHPILWTAAFFYALGGLFYFLQNNFIQIGGQVAFVKVMWLMTAIFLWFLFPLFIFRSHRWSADVRLLLQVFWGLMIARGIIELFLMYVTRTWHPYMGIAHDIVCALLLMAVFLPRIKSGALAQTTCGFLSVTLLVEAGFAYYMLTQVKSDEPVYYVPNHAQHNLIFTVTWIVIVASILFLLSFTQRWVRLNIQRRRNC